MKSKIILVVILLASLVLGITLVANATDDLQVRSSINVEDVVGEDANYDDLINPISLNPEDHDEILPVGEELKRGDVYVLEDNASIESYIDGNLYVLADNVDIASYVDGNVFLMGKNITIKGDITGSLFACGENINFLSGYAKDVYFYSENIFMTENASIEREAKMFAETITISGLINGDTYTSAKKVIVTDNAIIDGKLTYYGELSKASEDQIGSIEKKEIKLPEISTKSKVISKVERILIKTTTALIITGLIVVATNKKMEGNITLSGTLKGVFAGAGWIVLIPIIVIFLMLSIVGLPAALILLILYVLMYFVAIPAVALQISAYILNIKNKDSKLLLWLLAVVIYCALAIVRLIPILGAILTILLGTYGFNLILKTIFSKKKKEVNIEPVVE